LSFESVAHDNAAWGSRDRRAAYVTATLESFPPPVWRL